MANQVHIPIEKKGEVKQFLATGAILFLSIFFYLNTDTAQ